MEQEQQAHHRQQEANGHVGDVVDEKGAPGGLDILGCQIALDGDLIRAGRFAKARKAFSRIIENWPDFEPAYCYSIVAFAELGEFERAEQHFYMAQQLTDRCPHCYYHMGWAKFKQQDYQRAIFAWNKTLELHPGYPGAKQHLAECYRAKGDVAEARRDAVAAAAALGQLVVTGERIRPTRQGLAVADRLAAELA